MGECEGEKGSYYVAMICTATLCLTVGATSLGSNENTLVVGPAPAGGTGEGGQILLQAPGGTYTSASMWDNYQNQTRLLRGTNTGSDAVITSFNMQSGQMTLAKYTGSGAFSGTVAANLAVDSSGNVLTVAPGTTTSASYATTASYVQNAQTASYVLNAISASYALTASYVLNAISASYSTTASYYGGSVTSASYATTASYVTGSVHNSANPALSSSYAVTASYATTALSSSYSSTTSFATATGLVESISFQDSNTGIAAQTYTLELYAEYGYTINELRIIAGGGTCTAAVQINGTPVTGISAVSVSTTIAVGTATAANTVLSNTSTSTGYLTFSNTIANGYTSLIKSSGISANLGNNSISATTFIGNANFVSANQGDYRELAFAPGVGGVANNSVSYTSGSTSYSKFKTFSIKIVMTGTDTTDVPKVRDLRAIALPSGA